MSDTNLTTVYSPLGEKFELSPANARDVIRHAKWTEHQPHPDAVREYCETNGIDLPSDVTAAPETPAPAAPEAPAPEAPAAPETPAPAAPEAPAPEAPAAPETPAPAAPEAPEEVQEEDEAPALKTVPSDFADMDKEAVKAYIDATFPGTEIDGRKGRDALVAQALELAAARA